MHKKPKNTYLQQEKQPEATLGWWQSISSTVTNFNYMANKTLSEFRQKIFEPEEDTFNKQIVIQGKKYNNKKQAKLIVKKILWFSYRKGFHIKNDYASDVGWGCLARVGQMALASALSKHFESLCQRLNLNSSESDIENLIAAFSDIEVMRQKYSLNKILEVADQLFKIKGGQWFSISSISTCLQKLQNKHPMRGAAGLKVIFCNQSINVEKIFKLQNLPVCQCTKQVVMCEKCHSNYKRQTHSVLVKNPQGLIQTLILPSKNKNQQSSNNQSSNFKKEKTQHQTKGIKLQHNNFKTKNIHSPLQVFRNRVFDKDLYLIVLTRTVDPKNAQNINKAIFKLLDLSFCLGIMTGFPRQAIFVVGRQDNKLIYLNPHYVQQHESKDMSNKDSHFCQQYLTCQRTELGPSMGFCFYIQTVAELQKLSYTIQQIYKRYQNTLSIGFDFGWSDYEAKDYIEDDNDDDNFSSLSFESSYQP